MFKRNTKDKIAIIGSYPPPYGGISVHIKRMTDLLPKDTFTLFDQRNNKPEHIHSIGFRGKIKFIKAILLTSSKYKIIHHHTPDKYMRLLLCLLGLVKKNIFLHIHGAGLTDILGERSLLSFLFKKLLKYVHIIGDNERICSYLGKYNPRSIREIDAFVPPIFNNEIFNDFVKKVNIPDAKIVISFMGWFSSYNNEDLYGFDLALKALDILRKEYKLDAIIIASVNGIVDDSIHKQFLDNREKLHLDDKFILINEELKEIWPVFLISDVFIRPTNTDGNSISLKEALWFECSTIASDVVPRPQDVVLFKNRDYIDLAKKIYMISQEKHILKPNERINRIVNKKYNNILLKEIYKIER